MNEAARSTFVVVDVGNTNAKFQWYLTIDGPGVQDVQGRVHRPTGDIWNAAWFSDMLFELFAHRPAPAKIQWFVASVHQGAARQLIEIISSYRQGDTCRRLSNSDVPLAVDVQRPDRVGVDRLLAAVAANHLRCALRPAIVVDAGSAITVDVVSRDGIFQGGAILPGIRMQAGVLSTRTDGLPRVDLSAEAGQPEALGKSTEAAIRSGVLIGAVGAVRELVRRMSEVLCDAPQLFVTGGDMWHFKSLAETDTQFVVDLVMQGIVHTARHLAGAPAGS